MLNEEVIRSLLDYLDKKRLQKNADSNKPHQDFEVFQDAARWLAFYGDKWLNNEGRFAIESQTITFYKNFRV